jgi:hypothetical protein
LNNDRRTRYFFGPFSLLDRRTKRGPNTIAGHGDYIVSDIPWRDSQVTVHRPEGIETLVLAVDDDHYRCIFFHNYLVANACEGGLEIRPAPLHFLRDGDRAHVPVEMQCTGSPGADTPVNPVWLGVCLEIPIGSVGSFRVT